MASCKTIFMGNSSFGLAAMDAIANSAHSLQATVTGPDFRSGRGRKMHPTPVARASHAMGVPVHRYQRPGQALDLIQSLSPDVIVVCDYGALIPKAILQQPRMGCLNIHPSLLPRWRGAAPIERAILAGDEVTGISIMLMDSGWDTGPVLLSRQVPVGSRTCGELRSELSGIGARMIVNAMDRLDVFTPHRQNEREAVYAGKITPDDMEIDWTESALAVERRIRAFAPEPCARTHLGSCLIKIGKASILDEPLGVPGTIVEVSKQALTVACGEGSLAVCLLQKPGGRMMPTQDFLNGTELKVGMCFKSPGSSVDRANPS